MVRSRLHPSGRRTSLSLALSRACPAQARAETEVDLALVVAVDISFSMDTDEQALQREGFAQAFRSPLVHDAIRGGMLGRIAVTYMEWAGAAGPEGDRALDGSRQSREPDGLRRQDRLDAAAPRAAHLDLRAPSISA